ncbi:unnamed protein product [Leptosia nina]|uniref:Amino acid transporter transmembrane domain-containing protein n=1 Tax=Leptosia nina TaxID=320188 RepID=A0AAV1JZJ0_9NEOP
MSKKSQLEVEAAAMRPTATESTPLVSKEGVDSADGGKDGGPTRGLSVRQTAILVAGEMAGSGVLALPRALVKTGLFTPLLLAMLSENSYLTCSAHRYKV